MAKSYLDDDGLLYFWQKIKNTFAKTTDIPTVPSAYTSNPAMNGTASAGSSTSWSRGDHVHPTDTSRAPLASPTFTGTPAAPTATAGTNNTQLATTAFVNTAVENAVAGNASFKGTVNANTDISSLSDYKVGWYWVVATAGTYVGETCELGDMIYCISNRASAYSASDFNVVQRNVDMSQYLTNVAWDSTNGKLTETKGGSTTDVVTASTIKSAMSLTKSDVGLGNVDNTADANKTVNAADHLTSNHYIEGIKYVGSNDIVYYGTCSTGTSTAAKVVTMTSSAFQNSVLSAGARAIVNFSNAVNADSATPTYTIKVGNTSAQPFRGKSDSNSPISVQIPAKSLVEIVYDGSRWVLVGYTPIVTATITQSEITAGTSTDSRLVTPKLLVDNFASVAITNAQIDTIVAS